MVGSLPSLAAPGGSAGPSSAANYTDQIFGAGWTVSTGSSSAAGAGTEFPAWAIVAAVALLVVGWVKVNRAR